MDLREVGWGTYGLDLRQNTDRWRAFVSGVTNIRVP